VDVDDDDDDDENDVCDDDLVKYTNITLNDYVRNHDNFHHRYYIIIDTV
jgi:hypothetical protein